MGGLRQLSVSLRTESNRCYLFTCSVCFHFVYYAYGLIPPAWVASAADQAVEALPIRGSQV